MRLWALSLLQDGGMVPWVHIQVLTLPTDQSWESTLSHTNTLNISPSSSPPARKFCRDTYGYGCPVHDLWGIMEGAGLCGDPVVQRSAVPGSSLRVLTMPSVGAQDPSHYGLESSCPQTKPSPLRVPSGESGHFFVHLSLTGAAPFCEPSSLVGETLSSALMVLIFLVVMAKMPPSSELRFHPFPRWNQREMKRLLIPITLPGTSGVRNRGRGL